MEEANQDPHQHTRRRATIARSPLMMAVLYPLLGIKHVPAFVRHGVTPIGKAGAGLGLCRQACRQLRIGNSIVQRPPQNGVCRSPNERLPWQATINGR